MENKTTDSNRIAITGIGLVTSLGLSTPSSFAAIRGGIADFFEHDTVMVNGDRYGTELCGAKIARLPEHIVSRHVSEMDRAVALLAPALRECLDGLPIDMLARAHWRIGNLIDPWNDNLAGKLKEKLHDMPIPGIHPHDIAGLALGRCLFFEDIIQAAAELSNETCKLAIVGSVDSLCITTVLARLCEADRLKSGSNPEGLVAGEAAGVVLLELESHARRRNAAVHAYISAWGSSVEEHPFNGTEPSRVKGLTSAFRNAFAQLPAKGKEIDMVIADLNGERARAYEWGYTAGRIFPIDDKQRELMHPADCTGDCGAAMGAVLLAAAVGFMGGAFPPLKIALSTSDDCGARCVLCIEKGDDFDKVTVIRGKCEKRLTTLPSIIEQHKDEVSFLWLQRNRLINAPHYGLDELVRHDERVEAHLDGLLLAGEAGWEVCKEALKSPYFEDVFAAAVLALESGKTARIRAVLDAIGEDRHKAQALISAFGWIPYEQAAPHIKNLFGSQLPFHRYIGLAASALHRRDPGKYLDDAIFDADPLLKARALRTVGEVGGRCSLLSGRLKENLTAEDTEVRFSAAWSAALLGDTGAAEVLKNFVEPTFRCREKAMNAALRRMRPAAALAWQKELASDPRTIRPAVIGAAIIGDAVLIPWLLEQMRVPALARIAGEAFSMITGMDIERENLKGEQPDDFGTGPNDDPRDCNVAMDPDEGLPWPDPGLIAVWWDKNGGRFQCGTRYLLGKPVSTDHLRHVLRTGCQRQRVAAAMELAIMEPGRPLFEVRAPAFRQIQQLQVIR
jgi:uncharacterized protein (TIGR02270 family)